MNCLWNYCSFCGKRIETGEKCYGLPNGESVCTDCCVSENEGATEVHGHLIEREEKPICRSCNFMLVTSYAKTTGNNRHLKGSRGNCMCKHPDAVKTFNKVCPRSPRMAAFIGYTPPGETKPALKTSPTWCPMRPENKKE